MYRARSEIIHSGSIVEYGLNEDVDSAIAPCQMYKVRQPRLERDLTWTADRPECPAQTENIAPFRQC
jgi:hypothetical protein